MNQGRLSFFSVHRLKILISQSHDFTQSHDQHLQDAQPAIITQPASEVAAAPAAIISASTVATSTLSTNTTTQAAPIEPVISALEPVDEIEPELSERLEDETEEDDRFKPGETLIDPHIWNLLYSVFTTDPNPNFNQPLSFGFELTLAGKSKLRDVREVP